jgi:hypothetical protein
LAARDARAARAAWDEAEFKKQIKSTLRPRVAAIEQSALVLIDRMLAVTPETTDDELLALCEWPAIEIVN